MAYIEGFGQVEDIPGYYAQAIVMQGQVVGVSYVENPAAAPPAQQQPAPVTQAPLAPPAGAVTGTFAEFAWLTDLGLPSSLADYIYESSKLGTPAPSIMAEVRKRPEYKARFPGMDQLAREGRAITEREYVGLEAGYREAMRELPPGFYDQPSDFAAFIIGSASPAEVRARVEQGYVASQQAPAEVRSQLRLLFGIGDDQLAAFYLNPERAFSQIMQTQAAAERAGAAIRTGFGQLTQTEAERLVALGVTGAQAQEGFGTLAASQELFAPLPGETAGTIGREQQLAAAFGGDAAARAAIERRAGRRKAEFAAGGEFAAGSKGVSGLASAAG